MKDQKDIKYGALALKVLKFLGMIIIKLLAGVCWIVLSLLLVIGTEAKKSLHSFLFTKEKF